MRRLLRGANFHILAARFRSDGEIFEVAGLAGLEGDFLFRSGADDRKGFFITRVKCGGDEFAILPGLIEFVPAVDADAGEFPSRKFRRASGHEFESSGLREGDHLDHQARQREHAVEVVDPVVSRQVRRRPSCRDDRCR
jgi:hypothetical protein